MSNRHPLWLAIIFTLLLTLTPVIASGETTISMWATRLPGTFNDWVVNEFPKLVKEAYPDITVTVTVMGSRQELEEKRTVAAASGVAVDIFHESGVFGYQIGENGSAFPLDSYISKWSGASDLIPIPHWTYKGQTFAIPYAINITGIGYWQDLLAQGGVTPPKSWSELLSAGKKLTIPGDSGVLKQAGLTTWGLAAFDGLYNLQVFTQQLGSSVYSADLKQPQFDTTESHRALQMAKDLYDVAYPAGAKPATGWPNRGAAIMFWYSNWHTPGLHSIYSREDLDNVRLARVPGPTGEATSVGIADSFAWAISQTSKNKDAAWKVITRFLDKDVVMSFLYAFTPGGVFSPRKSTQYPKEWPFVADAVKMSQPPIVSWGPVHPYMNDVLRITETPIFEAVSGKRALAGALEEANRLVKQMFVEKGYK